MPHCVTTGHDTTTLQSAGLSAKIRLPRVRFMRLRTAQALRSEGDALNDYFYVYNQPTRYIDPTGLIGLRIGPYCGLKQDRNWPDVSENSIDFCCRHHDLCYSSRDIGSGGGASDPQKECDVYNCDMSICRCAVRNYHGSARDKALIKLIKIRFKCKKREGHPPEGCCTAF
jgi:hypothetical protein